MANESTQRTPTPPGHGRLAGGRELPSGALPGDTVPPAVQTAGSQAFWCCLYAAGIIGMLVLYGILQERIMTEPYGDEDFTVSVFLVFCNRVAAVIFAFGMALGHRESFANKAPLWKYLIVSLSNVYASTCQYEALKYVSFAVQMLGKSFKMMPVMVWGMAISGKSYSLRDWCVALFVTGGVTEFLMTGPITSSHDNGNSIKGLVLLLGFLALDGLTSTMQEKLFKEHATSKYNQMMYINGISACVSLVTLLTSGSFPEVFAFCGNHPKLLGDASLLSVSAVAGQFFIYSQVKEFGALVFAATMNVRQVVSILVSYINYHHSITPLQVLGLFLVFAALFYKSAVGLFAPEEKGEKAPRLPKMEEDSSLNVDEGKEASAKV
mmetsp:Transcript_39709/g.86560  ORF Transcript_39709/g.86560 Transcript_39709/m.86560 type:complete len:380 (+) Transcript_39709:73-1212(+)